MKLTLARKPSLSEGKIFRVTLKKNKKYLSLRLPKKIADYLQINKSGEIFWTALDNTIQLTGSNPRVGIPLFEFKKEKFFEQS